MLAGFEIRAHWQRIAPVATVAGRVADTMAPQIIGIAVFCGGAILLFSTATPAIESRMDMLRDFLPLPFVETSHFLGSIAGLILMLLARGLFRRLDGAFHLTVAVLIAGIAFSLLKGFDYEEATILVVLLTALLAARHAFYRKSSLFDMRFSAPWVATIAIVVSAAMWVGFFVFKKVPYSDALWWQFAYQGDAPRFMRAGVAVTVLGLAFVVANLLRPARPHGMETSPDLQSLLPVIDRSPRTDSHLALTGDKRFLSAEDGEAFIMYQVRGRSWIALGDPVGPEDQWEPLLWRFHEMCDRYDGWPVFYQIGADRLTAYLDLGMSLLKIGEEAKVDLAAFTLDGPERKDLRYAVRRAEREGAEFGMVPAADVPALLPELRAVSDEWMHDRSTHEKGFSVGHFDETYLSRFDCAVIRHDGAVVAFANVWLSAVGGEVSFDLMRHRKEAPYGVMDFLIVRLMEWARDEGYTCLNLGMAPLSGLEAHRLAPFWHRAGNMVYRHGENFYNFEGLRAFKEKFGPEWSPKYLATPGGFNLPAILLDIAALISGGDIQIFRK
jgi:phosphatidylglycerol lysyltransferase